MEILTDYERRKDDDGSDSIFYSQPRYVHHLDQGFRKCLTELYRSRIPKDSIILDLMSSWVSHLPENINYKRVIGHGLNQSELKKNLKLDSFWVQDLNRDQKLPLEDSSIDICLMVAAWQYLQYPEKIASELRRIVSPGGKVIISFSNRAFWTKTPYVWKEGNDYDHINYINNVLTSQGWTNLEKVVVENTGKGISSFLGISGDPFFCVIATN